MTTSELEVNTTSNGRFYKLPNGTWAPSVTTVISEMSDKSGLIKWRERIGHKAADRYMKHRALIGTNIHDMFEEMLRDESYKPSGDYLLKDIYRKCKNDILAFQPVLIEGQVWSERLQIAGRCDLIAQVDDGLMVVDFKSYKDLKKEEYLQNYLLQGTLYACMAYECGKISKLPKYIQIYGTCENVPTVQITTKNTKDYLEPAISMVNKYWSQNKKQ